MEKDIKLLMYITPKLSRGVKTAAAICNYSHTAVLCGTLTATPHKLRCMRNLC